ncbi:hypothetical protein BpHYR1_047033 [Brachionus plicatilis]|uniref:Uncharacterized protein n=1 Tax=Brachionus plicatilis TaxID=10195 RepID=A0A3M7SQK6_BRAPC|nr:hypothetical protein BpHYR1_047033 [Brachionus plicatilis]
MRKTSIYHLISMIVRQNILVPTKVLIRKSSMAIPNDKHENLSLALLFNKLFLFINLYGISSHSQQSSKQKVHSCWKILQNFCDWRADFNESYKNGQFCLNAILFNRKNFMLEATNFINLD